MTSRRLFRVLVSHIVVVYPFNGVWLWRVHRRDALERHPYWRIGDVIGDGHRRFRWLALCAAIRCAERDGRLR